MSRLKKQTKLTKFIAIPGAVILLWLVFIISGCGGPPPPPPKPRVIVKKMPVEKISKPTAQQPSKAGLSATVKTKDAPKDTTDKKPVKPSETGKPAGKKQTVFIATYDPTGKIDPFESPLQKPEQAEKTATDKKAKKDARIPRPPTTPLEFIDLNQLKLMGIIRAGSGNRALVQEATGKGYVIKKGTYIGRNEGVVKQIFRDRIIIKEIVKDLYGEEKTQNTELRIEKPPGEL